MKKVDCTNSVIKDDKKNTTQAELLGKKIFVNNNIGMSEYVLFIDSVVDACFSESGEYLPEYKDYAFNYMLIKMYTNISIDKFEDDTDAIYDFIMNSGVIDIIMKNCNLYQIEKIKESIDEKISYEKNTRINEINKQVEYIYSVVSKLCESVGLVKEEIGTDIIKEMIDAADKYSTNEIIKEMVINDTDGC